jgi:hypothetical protein
MQDIAVVTVANSSITALEELFSKLMAFGLLDLQI